MKYSIDKQKHYTIFSLQESKLDSLISPDLKSEFIILRNEGIKNLILNLEDVSFVDSSGLSAILAANRLWKDFGSFVVARAEHPSVKKLIEISRIGSVLTLIPTIEEAKDYIMMEELERELSADDEDSE
jgi:anti-sigma B factor antagonist